MPKYRVRLYRSSKNIYIDAENILEAAQIVRKQNKFHSGFRIKENRLPSIELLNEQSDRNLVRFYAEELKKIMSGAKPQTVLQNYAIKKLRQIGVIITSRKEPTHVSEWARNILEA